MKFGHLVERFRMNKAVKKWNDDIPLILAMSKVNDEGQFKWKQLVWQEIRMYIRLAEQVDNREFCSLRVSSGGKRAQGDGPGWSARGFDPMMQAYLILMLKHVGLGKRLLEPNMYVGADKSDPGPIPDIACKEAL